VSAGMRHGSAPPRPITPFADTAAITLTRRVGSSMLEQALSPACAITLFVLAVLALAVLARRTPRHVFRAAVKDASVSVVYDDCMHAGWTERAIAEIAAEAQQERMLGVDCEWKPEWRRCPSKVALLQVCIGHACLRPCMYSRVAQFLRAACLQQQGVRRARVAPAAAPRKHPRAAGGPMRV
jgi:hypothetical protein